MTRLSRNIIFNFFGQLLTLALSFVAVRFIFRRLGGDALGIIYFTQTIAALITASLSLGIGATTVREVAGHSRDEPLYVRDWVRTASSFYWSLLVVLAVALWSLVPLLVRHWINLSTMSEAEAIRALRILGIASLLALPKTLYASVLRGLERMDVTNATEVAVIAVQQLGAIVILSRGGGIFAVVWWLAACRLLSLAAYAIWTAWTFSPAALVPGFSVAAIRRNLRYAVGAMGITIFGAVRLQGDRAIVSKLLPLGTLGFYSFAVSAARRIRSLGTVVSAACFPSFSALRAVGDEASLVRQYWKLQDLVCWSLAPVSALLAFAAVPLFTAVFSPEVAMAMHLPTLVLCLGAYMATTAGVPHALVMASGKPEIPARLNFLSLVIVLPLTVLLTYYWGLTGAALSWVWHFAIGYLYAIPHICRECTNFSPWAWYKHIARVFAAIALTYGTAWGVLALLHTHSIPALAVAYTVATMVYVVAAWLMIGPELKGTIKGHASRLFGGSRRGGDSERP